MPALGSNPPRIWLRRTLAAALSIPWATLAAALAEGTPWPRPALGAAWVLLVAAFTTAILLLDARLPRSPLGLVARAMGGVVSWVFVMPVALFAWLSPFSTRKLEKPSDCIVPLAKTESCEGESDGFTECHYHFRAEGQPQATRCHAFTSAEPPPSAGRCTYESPAGWRSVPCEDHGLLASFRCFRCDVDEPERARRYVDAFAADCGREIILVGCNMDPGGGALKR